ncbi:uncharacterized protein LOC143231152 [Tachypleus tridentatus]|uniref:uncharacterized protein LOC143231152 n=1 Tax=Tachypleus tridentatus TaxID=6853 RepID=UPI003FD63D6F
MKTSIILATFLVSLTLAELPEQKTLSDDDGVQIIEIVDEDKYDVGENQYLNRTEDLSPKSFREGRFLPIFLDSYGRQVPPSVSGVGGVALMGLVGLGTMALLYPVLTSLETKDLEKLNEIDLNDAGGFVSKSLTGMSRNVMAYVEDTLDGLPSFPQLDAQECMKRTVCEAHNKPMKYGVLGLLVQLFFPPYLEIEEPLNVVSKYQLAARYGRQDEANCAKQYDGCMVSFLDLVQTVVNAFVK